jgi:spoIIIJ-associated protein
VDEKKYNAASISPRVEAFLQPLLPRARFELDFEVVEGQNPHPDFENPEVVVKFTGPDVELLLANRAELLLALEQITMEVLGMPPEDHARLCFDSEDYRILRIEELRVSALTAAEKVKQTGRPFHFNPMTSRERRIVHLALRGETAVRSESYGFGSARQVVICPAGMPAGSVTAEPLPSRGPQGMRRRRR